MPRQLAFSVIVLFCCAASAPAQENWSLTTADLKTDVVTVKSLDATGLKVAPPAGGADRAIPLEQFVEMSRAVATAKRDGKFDLHLVGGDRLNGEPVGMKDEGIVWKNPVVGTVTVPFRLVAALTKVDGRVALDRRKEDAITLANGDAVRGTITDLSPQQITIKTDAGETPVPFPSMVSVLFAATAQAPGKEKPSFRIRLDEGSALYASAATLADGKLNATVAGTPLSIATARLALVEQINGPVAFLSSRSPSANVYTPYLGSDQRFIARFNSDFDGNPIRFRDKVYARSIAAHAYSRITWPLDGSYAAFRTRYAMDPKAGTGTGGDVTVRIKLDDKVVHEQQNVRPGILSPAVLIDLTGGKTLTLEVDYGKMLDSNDRLNWLEPALLKFKPE